MQDQAIWHGQRSEAAPYVYLKQNFILSGPVAQAGLQSACSGPYALYCNGQLVGRGPGPEFVSASVWTEWDPTDFLQSGENILLVLARERADGLPASWFRLRLSVTYADGQQVELASGRPWQVQRADAWQRLDQAPLTTAYLATEDAADWAMGREGAGGWEDAKVVAAEDEEPRWWNPLGVEEREIAARRVVVFGETGANGSLGWETDPGPLRQVKCVHREALLQPGKARALVQIRGAERAVYLVLDLGRLASGFPRLRLVARAGAVVDVGLATSAGKLIEGVRYVCRDGVQEWTGQQLWRGRYLVVRISHSPEELEVDSVSLVERWVPVGERAVSGFSGESVLDSFWTTGRQTLEACRQELYALPSATGQYDWLGALALALDDYYLSGETQTAQATLTSARPPLPKPGDWVAGLAYILFGEAYFRHAGDGPVMVELLANWAQILAAYRAQQGANGLLHEPDEGETGLSVNALYGGALGAAARLCRDLGDKEEARLYKEQQRQVEASLQQWWVADQGLFCVGGEGPGQWGNGLVLLFGLTSRERREKMVSRIRVAAGKPVADLRQAFFLAGGLWQAGAGGRALDYMLGQWGRIVDRTGSTWGEKAIPAGVLPGPEFYIGSQLLGVRPAAPGFAQVEIQPFCAGLERAEGRINTRRGRVEVVWGRSSSMLYLKVSLEKAGPTQLNVPRLGRSFPTVVLNGETVWRNEKIQPNFAVQDYISTADYIGLMLNGSGEYVVELD
ncbi:MAG: hypothetical protein GKR89_04485 [Candidatus Latescibacteria bacterium]|nr:hypothetical protein [Candidatus Latescibacterota bacterium]